MKVIFAGFCLAFAVRGAASFGMSVESGNPSIFSAVLAIAFGGLALELSYRAGADK